MTDAAGMSGSRPLTFFITGASSGIGFALSRAAAERDDNVIAIARDVEAVAALADDHPSRVLALGCDVRDETQVANAVAQAISRFSQIDVVHNNAGYGVFGAVEEVSDELARGIFDTNVFGVLNVLRATLPALRRQGHGHILQGSSYYGQTAHPGVGLLSATKYAVEGLTDALVGELAPLGIKVTLVQPGPTATPFGSNFKSASVTIADYDQTVREVAKATAALPASAFDSPDRVASAILAAVDAERPPLRLATGTSGLGQMRTALQSRLDDYEAWRPVTEAVDSTPAAA